MLVAAVEPVEIDREPVRFLSIVEAPKYQFPLRPIPNSWWTPAKMAQTWERISGYPYMLADLVKKQKEAFAKGTVSGDIRWFELGGGAGYAHVFNRQEDGTADLNFEFVGDHRAFLKKYGDGRECLDLSVTAIMRWLKLRKLRAFVVAANGASVAMTKRCGFQQEGYLRQEWIVNGQPEDVIVFGRLAEATWQTR